MGDPTFRPFGGGAVAVLAGEERRRASRYFADEVAIDFPSIDEAVDRDAAAGAVLPLEVAVRCVCRQCGGRGESWAEHCAGCAGTGAEYLQHQVQVSLPAGVADGARFHFTVTPRHHPPTLVELRVSVA
jgi:hypothetical protein